MKIQPIIVDKGKQIFKMTIIKKGQHDAKTAEFSATVEEAATILVWCKMEKLRTIGNFQDMIRGTDFDHGNGSRVIGGISLFAATLAKASAANITFRLKAKPLSSSDVVDKLNGCIP